MTRYLFTIALVISVLSLRAQTAPHNTYILPDGTILPAAKIDSLNQAWGKGRVMMQHSSADDEKGIMHLVRMTDEMATQFAEAAAKREAALHAMINHPAPDFTLTDLHGQQWALSTLKGKVVVLNFWFTSCPPCLMEMPELNTLTHQYDSAKVLFLALTFNEAKNVKAFLQDHHFDYILLPGAQEVDERYQVNSWPTSFVIDKNGIITLASGYSPDIRQQLKTAIDAAF